MIIEVYRGAGDRSGSPIVEPLLADDVLIHRGRAEMDANAHEINRVALSVKHRVGVRLGQLIEASDPASAAPYRGKVTGISLTVRGAEVDHTVDLEVPLP
jgi:hypothetical protein